MIVMTSFNPPLGLGGDADSLELFRLKNDFMYSVFNKCLLSDMCKTIVRKHLDNMNAGQGGVCHPYDHLLQGHG